MTFDLGSTVRLSASIVDADGAAADPTAIALTVTLPDGTTAVATPTRASTGSYTADYATTAAGRHLAAWIATGANASSYYDVFDVRDPADLPVVGLADAKAHLNIAVTTYDAELRRYLDAATDMCEGYAGRSLRRRSVTESHDGGSTAILLRQTPVLSVSSVVADGTALSGYAIDLPNGILRADDDGSTTFPGGHQAVAVSYVAGYAAPPADVQQAVLEALRHLWTTQRGGMDARKPFGGDEYANGTGWSLPRRVMELLEPYALRGA